MRPPVGPRALAWLVAALLLAGCGTAAGDLGAEAPRPPASGAAWTAVAESPLSARHNAVATWVGERFIVVGGSASPPCPPGAGCGRPEQPPLRDGASLDPATGRWQPIADAPVPISESRAVVVGGRVYVLTPNLGRADSPVSFLAYDPRRDTWAKLPRPRSSGVLVAAGKSVVVIPNSDEQRPAVDMAFDPGAGTWRPLPDDPLIRKWMVSGQAEGGVERSGAG